MYGKQQNIFFGLLLLTVGVVTSLAGLITHTERTAQLIFQTVLLDICFGALAAYGYLFNERLQRIRNFDAGSLSKADKRNIRISFSKSRLPTSARLKSIAIKYARADIRYQEAVLSPIGLISFTVYIVGILVLINLEYQLYWLPSLSIYDNLLFFVVVTVASLAVNAKVRKRRVQKILSQTK
jgi:hypothetical protein